MRQATFSIVLLLTGIATDSLSAMAAQAGPQGPQPIVSGALPSTAGVPSIPSIENMAVQNGPTAKNNAPRAVAHKELPSANGQQWVEYDIRPYTQNLKNVERPQQVILDWILRETGTDVWFNEPMGIINADRSTLSVYHNAEIQKKVSQIYDKFVNGLTEPQVFGLRLITIGNPNWRTKTTGLMRSAPVETPGVQAWLMPKENAAIFLAQLRSRIDVRELQAVNISLVNGQTQTLEQLRSRNYLREYQQNTATSWPPYTPVSDEILEGYKLQVSPLMSMDGRSVDLMLKCDIDQVERLNNVSIDLPMPASLPQSVQIEVPQVVSWRLHERFRWPADQVLLLSCGVVAAPAAQVNNTLLSGNPPTLFGLNKILPAATGQRTDALFLIEYRGPASTQLNQPIASPSASPTPSPQSASSNVSRGRY